MKKTILIAAALVAMTACNKSLIEVSPVEDGFGYINLGVTTDTEMVVTKADGETQTVDLSGYNVTLKQGDVAKWTKEYDEIDPEDWKVAAGTYSIYVENLTVEETYATEPGVVRVSGENTVVVTAGVSTPCEVKCAPQNSKVSLMYTPDFDVVFNDPSVSVKESDARTVAMTVGQ